MARNILAMIFLAKYPLQDDPTRPAGDWRGRNRREPGRLDVAVAGAWRASSAY